MVFHIHNLRSFLDHPDLNNEQGSCSDFLKHQRSSYPHSMQHSTRPILNVFDECWYYEMAIQDQSEERVRSLSVEELPEEYKKIKNHIQSM